MESINKAGFFGGQHALIIDEPKKESTNPFNEYKRVMEGFSPDSNMLIPLMNWFSNTKHNIREMQAINRLFFYADKKILSHQLLLTINRNIKFIKYPKKNIIAHDFAFLIPYIQQYYGWSDREFMFYSKFIDLDDEELHRTLHKQFALDKKELRKLGIKQEKITQKYEKTSRVKGFF